MEDLRYFAILDENNKVVNISTFPKEDKKVIKYNLDSKCIWVNTGNFWENRDYQYYLEDFHHKVGVVDFVETITDDPQEFLNINFPNSVKHDIVIVESNIPLEEEILQTPEILLESYPKEYKIQEYSYDGSISNKPASITNIYDEDLNEFISTDPEDL